MKKKLVATLVALAMLTSITASVFATPRWTYFSIISTILEMQKGSLKWGADADTYYATDVTATKCKVTLQAANSFGWYTIDTDTTMLPGNYAGAGGLYADWEPDTSYRIKVEAWAYIGNSVVESVGPFYEYYNT